MTEPPKRRGRPPGSKNRPNVVLFKPNAETFGPEWKPGGTFEGPVEQAGYAEAIAGPEPIKVVLSAKRRDAAFGDPNSADEQEIEWPATWRLPQPGDSVHLRKDWGGFVSSVDFDLETQTVRVFLR